MGRSALAVVGAFILLGGSAIAHHSYTDFFLDQSASVDGYIQQLRFASPHVVLTIRTSDETEYTATWAAAARVERDGVTRTTLKIGDRVIVTGAPPRDAASRQLMPIWEIRRPSDGWVWRHTRGPLPTASN